MNEIKANLYPCKHCNETGTCTSGEDGTSCFACVKRNELKTSKSYTGLFCSICGGLGKGEPLTERMNKRITPILAIIILSLLLLFSFLLAVYDNTNFSTFIAFASTLSASIITFYFSGNKK